MSFDTRKAMWHRQQRKNRGAPKDDCSVHDDTDSTTGYGSDEIQPGKSASQWWLPSESILRFQD